MIAARLGVPVIPVRLEGLDRILHQTWKFPRRGRATITFGAPMSLKGQRLRRSLARTGWKRPSRNAELLNAEI